MTFLSGFAEGFTTERKSRIDRENEKEDMSFKYNMDALTKQRDKREKTSLQETEYANQAKLIAKEIGDPSFAPVAMDYLRNGITVDAVLSDARAGNFKKDPSGAATQPSRTIELPTTKAMPDGVTGTISSMAPSDNAVAAANGTPIGVAGSYKDPAVRVVGPQSDKVAARIREVDPTLLDQPETPTVYPTSSATNGWKFEKKNELKLGNYKDSLLKLEKGKQEKNPAMIREANMEINIHRTVMADEANAKAKADGKNTSMYIIKDSKTNKMVPGSTFAGEVRDDEASGNGKILVNIADPTKETPVQLKDGQELVPLRGDATKDYLSLAKDFDKASGDVNAATDKFIGATRTTRSIFDVLERNPSVTTYAATGVDLARQLQDEVAGAYNALTNQEKDIEDALGKDGSIADVEQKIDQYEKGVQSLLSQPNKDLATDKAIYDSLRKLAAYQFAAANGVNGRDMSNADFQRFYDITGGGKSKEAVQQALVLNGNTVFTQIDSAQRTLAKSAQIKAFKDTYGYDPGFEGTRIGDRMQEMGLNESLSPILKQFSSGHAEGLARASASATGEPSITQGNRGEVQNDPVRITGADDYNKLPVGALYYPPGSDKPKRKIK